MFLKSGPSSGLYSVYFLPSLWIAFFSLNVSFEKWVLYFLILMNFNLPFFFSLFKSGFL